MENYSYLHLGEPADPDRYVICKYRVSTDLPMEKAAEAIAAEQSTGTWTGISTLDSSIFERLGARIIDITGDMVTAEFPVDDFSIEVGSVPQILSVIAGNLFGLGALNGVRLEDVTFPKEITSQFKGPKFGAEGIRKALGRPEKPLVGTIVKPKIGLSPEKTAEYVYKAGSGGLTNSKDDETLVDQPFCPIQDRTVKVAEALDRLEMQVREYICEKQKFLNPKLNKTELARELGTNRTYLTTVFSERLGSFYSFVNKQRVEFARQYIKEHPKATQQEIALNSGFGSVKSYTRAKQTL